MDAKIVDLKIGDIVHSNNYPENICTIVYKHTNGSFVSRNSIDGVILSKGDNLGPLKEGDLYYFLSLESFKRDFVHCYKKIPDTKLARRLYKNMIHKEEGGKLWIKMV